MKEHHLDTWPHRISRTRLTTRLLILITASCSMSVQAGDFIVYSPHVTQSRSELEFRGSGFRDNSPNLKGTRSYTLSAAYGVTSWWKPELYFAQYDRQPGGSTQPSGYEFENTFQLAPMGKYWADPGFLFSYEHVKASGTPNVVEFGPLFEKRDGRIDQRLNMIWEKQVGRGAGGNYAFRTAYSIDYRLNVAFRPGIEAYYRPSDNASHLGPVFNGELHTTAGRELDYSVGVVFGLNSRAPNQTIVARLEYEF